MKIVAALDSFKGSLSSTLANGAVRDGALSICPDAEVITVEIADGGEGTGSIMTSELGGIIKTVEVLGPLGNRSKPITAQYGFVSQTGTAIIEMASAAGLTLLKEEDRNPLYTTTYGVGQMILDAIQNGAKNLIITIGGSATNDCGIGMLTALGFKFLDRDQNPVEGFGIDLCNIVTLDITTVNPLIKDVNFTVMCDVDNPLTGLLGCSYVYAPQKGADSKIVEQMDQWITNFATTTKEYFPQANKDYPGSGAAGGLGFALREYLGASLKPGIDVVINTIDLETKIKGADLVITGEGKIDEQSIHGKVISGVTNIAYKTNTTVGAICGLIAGDITPLYNIGIREIINIHPEDDRSLPLEILMSEEKSIEDIKNTVKSIVSKHI